MKATKQQTTPNRKELTLAAIDLNKILRPYPPIGYPKDATSLVPLDEMQDGERTGSIENALKKANPKKLGADELIVAIREQMVDVVGREQVDAGEADEVDPLSKGTWEVLAWLKSTGQQDEATADGPPVEPEQEAPPVGKKVKVTKPKKASKEPKLKKEKVQKPPKERKRLEFTRTHALMSRMTKWGTRDEIISDANVEYMEKGGTDNLQVTRRLYDFIILPLVIRKQIEEKDGKLRLMK